MTAAITQTRPYHCTDQSDHRCEARIQGDCSTCGQTVALCYVDGFEVDLMKVGLWRCSECDVAGREG